MELLNEGLTTTEIGEADRIAVYEELKKPGSKARNERGQLPVQTFKRIAKKIWTLS